MKMYLVSGNSTNQPKLCLIEIPCLKWYTTKDLYLAPTENRPTMLHSLTIPLPFQKYEDWLHPKKRGHHVADTPYWSPELTIRRTRQNFFSFLPSWYLSYQDLRRRLMIFEKETGDHSVTLSIKLRTTSTYLCHPGTLVLGNTWIVQLSNSRSKPGVRKIMVIAGDYKMSN